MSLSADLVSQFVKATNDKPATNKVSTVYGEAVIVDGETYIRIDGSDRLTPVETTTDMNDGDRVTATINNHTATVTGNISSPAARTDDVKEIGTKISEFETVVADKVSTKLFEAQVGRIDNLVSENVTVRNELTAANADITKLKVKDVEIDGTLTVNTAEIESLKTTKIDASIADIKYATIDNLKATNADVSNLDADVADINTLIFGSAAGDTIHTSFANAVIAQLGVAQIKSAMIDSVSADKITAGDIVTNNVRVLSEDGKLLISDETIQISDESRVRVQIGKDVSGDYSINIWDVDGNLMFSEGGITDNAIKDAIIRNDMVSDNANISASKLDIDSLFTEINGSSNIIKSSKIYLDDKEQTLNVAFETLESDLEDTNDTITSQGTQLNILQGKIDSKIWQQDIDTATGEMNTKYSSLEQNLNGFKTTVSDTYTTKNDTPSKESVEANAERIVVVESSIQQLANEIVTFITDEDGNSSLTQTSTGWTFSTSKVEDDLKNLLEDLDAVKNSGADTDAIITVMTQTLDDIGLKTSMVHTGTYTFTDEQGNTITEPSIELWQANESDPDADIHRLIITNKRILFGVGSHEPTRIFSDGLDTDNITVNEELRQTKNTVTGCYIWSVRDNGHYGLQWKGADV